MMCVVAGCPNQIRGYAGQPTTMSMDICAAHRVILYDCLGELDDLDQCLSRQGLSTPCLRWSSNFSFVRDGTAVLYLTLYYLTILEHLELVMCGWWNGTADLLNDIDTVYDNLARLLTYMRHA